MRAARMLRLGMGHWLTHPTVGVSASDLCEAISGSSETTKPLPGPILFNDAALSELASTSWHIALSHL